MYDRRHEYIAFYRKIHPVAKNIKSVPNDLKKIIDLLKTKYLYGEEMFQDGIQKIGASKRGVKDTKNALTLQVYAGVPFLLAVPVSSSDKIGDALQSAIHHSKGINSLGIIVIFENDTSTLNVYQRNFTNNEFAAIADLEYYNDSSTNAQQSLKLDDSSTGLLPITEKLENIFFEIHSVMRDIDGLHPDSALEELCKLLYVKLYIEEQPTQIPNNLVSSNRFGSKEEFSAAIRHLYKEAGDYDTRVFSLKIPEYERSRGVFSQPFSLSSAALTKSFQTLERYTLSNTKTDVKGRAFQKVLSGAIRSGMGQYFTPASVCHMMTKIVSPTTSDLVMDPFCGSGHFLSQSLIHVRENGTNDSKEFHEFAFGKLHGIEKSNRMTRIAMTDMRLNGDGHSNIRCADSLLDFRNYPDLREESFDVVLTNPPFGSLLGSEAFSGLAQFEIVEGRKKAPLEVIGLERSIQFLRPGGRLAIVLPEGIFSADSYSYVREWLLKHISIRAIIDLPVETFSPYGANVNSGILFARKRYEGELASEHEKVCMVKIENIGYDASGRDRDGSEVPEAIRAVTKFIATEGW